ncbi:hypothetical protein ABKN59_007725 [Abortiporus biennis]
MAPRTSLLSGSPYISTSSHGHSDRRTSSGSGHSASSNRPSATMSRSQPPPTPRPRYIQLPDTPTPPMRFMELPSSPRAQGSSLRGCRVPRFLSASHGISFDWNPNDRPNTISRHSLSEADLLLAVTDQELPSFNLACFGLNIIFEAQAGLATRGSKFVTVADLLAIIHAQLRMFVPPEEVPRDSSVSRAYHHRFGGEPRGSREGVRYIDLLVASLDARSVVFAGLSLSPADGVVVVHFRPL